MAGHQQAIPYFSPPIGCPSLDRPVVVQPFLLRVVIGNLTPALLACLSPLQGSDVRLCVGGGIRGLLRLMVR